MREENRNNPNATSQSIQSAKISALREYLKNFDSANEAKQFLESFITYKESREKQAKVDQLTKDSPILLKTDNLSKTYKIGKQRIEVLKNINLSIKQGEFIAITGASGSGKSTLLQLLGGLDKPTSGTIFYENTNLAKLSDAKLSRFRGQTIGFVFQFFYLQPFLSLEKNIEVPAMFAKTKGKVRKARTADLTSRVDLANRQKHLPKELSGGQMQRVAIARALMNQPKILLADEPTGNLDSLNSRGVIDLFEMIRNDFGTTVVLVTHDPEIASRADREIKIKDGEIIS